MRHIFLYGPPGSGKTTVGKLLAADLNLPFVDLDEEIEKTAEKTIPCIMDEQGEPAFRDLESAALEKAATGIASVIALGGGALLQDVNRACAESAGEVVLLDADLSTLLDRMITEPYQRPLLAGNTEQKLQRLLAQRKYHYGSFELRITTKAIRPESVAWKIQQTLGYFHVSGMGKGYDVVVQPDGFDRLGEILAERGLIGMVAVIADSNVAPLYGPEVLESLRGAGCKAQLLTIPVGEKYKTLETISSLWQGFLKAGLDRKSMVLALGGGVTGDLSGFAASTFMRGIQWVGLPTTLLAMVDSSLGGKTGCDLPEGKNLIGSFHSPRLVLSDPNALSTLPEDELRSGLGEVVKHGIIADPALFDLCSQGYDAVKINLPEIVRRAMAVKIKVIQADPFERGPRAALNLGHTVGHALENVSRYRLRHGEAVAIGMVVEARLAEKLKVAGSGLSEIIAEALQGLGLPVEIPSDMSHSDILCAMMYDKKKDSGMSRFALPAAIGDVRFDVDVENLDLIFTEA